jgi:hypothetical protein
MRHFWLKKGGKVWDLSASDLSKPNANFMGSPEGLGVKVKIDSFEIERAFFVENVKIESQEISGKLYFQDYAAFNSFVEFIGYVETSVPMRLYYSTTAAAPNYASDDEWYKLVLIKEIKKAEIDVKSGVLICDIKFTALSRWKKDQVITLKLEPFGAPLVYPYIYPYVYGGQNNMAVEIDNPGLPTSCIVKIEPETDTPLFRILKDGELLDQARYHVYVRPGSYALIDSSAEKQEASLYTTLSDGGQHREDVYYLGERDYAYSNFITIPEGKSLFLFGAVNIQFGKVTVQYSLQRELI